ncbi:ABC transporter ATP-binding protein [Sporanaerobacter acetigenes]
MFLTNGLSLSSFVVFLLLSSVFLTSFQKLTELGANFAMLICGAENVRKIMETKPQDNFGEISMANTYGKIQFENVNFKYEDEYVLKNFSLNVEPNSTIALVGPSGSGKTTAGMLVGRFWDVDEGKILIDGKDIKEYKQESLMENTAFVFQDVFMLNDTVYNNILMGMDRTEEEVIEAAKKAQIHDFIMSLEDGYQTVVGENTGIKLSGGEKQRISIARAILKDVKIVVLDEVTSYSDIENEKKIQDALKNLLKNKTAIIIAHRLYTIKNVDKIVVLDEGRIVEQGKHEDLINRNGLYNRLWNIGMEG